MKLNPKNFGLAGGILFALCKVIMTSLALFAGYGTEVMNLIVSLYPGYTISVAGIFLGAIYGFIDGFVAFYVFAWLYNKLEKK